MNTKPAVGLTGAVSGMSLRSKLLWLLTGVTFVALAVGLGLSVAGNIRLFRAETATTADNLATVLAEFSVAPLSFNDPDGARGVLARLEKTTEALAAVALYDADGNLFAAWTRPGERATCPESLATVRTGFTRGQYDAVRAVSHRGQELGTVVARLSTRGLEEKIHRYIGQVALIFVVVLGLCVALAYRLQRFISGPISRLADAAHAVSVQEDLSVRVRSEGRDEIGQLCDAFNLMLSRLDTRQRERDVVTRRLRESEAKYRGIVQDQTELVFRLGADGTLLFVNEAYCRYWQRRYESLIGTSLLADVAPVDRAAVQVQLAALTTADQLAQFAYRVGGPPEAERWHECTCRAIAGDGGRVIEIQGVARDITDLRRAERENRALARQLEHSHRLETIGTLAGGIAHDFNNILTPIVGYIDLARAQLAADSTAAGQLDIAATSAQRAKELIQRILTFSRAGESEKSPLRLQEVVAEALRLLGASLPRTIGLQTSLDPGCAPVLANAVQMHQLVVNLCTNAAQAIGTATGVLDIGVDRYTVPAGGVPTDSRPAPGSYVRLVVRDDGPGMTDSVRERIFEPFFTTKAPGEGTGLGLSVVHGIVAAHDGYVDVESRPGHGTTFTVLLPVTGRAVDGGPRLQPANLEGSGRVLVVDDEPVIAAMAERMLTRLGYDVTAVTHPEAAVSAFAKPGPDFDLVITDQTMPGMLGTQLVVLLSEFKPGLRVIITSGYNRDAPDYELPPGVQLVSILRKPFSMEELGSVVRQALGIGNS